MRGRSSIPSTRTPPEQIESPDAQAAPLFAVDYVADWATRRPKMSHIPTTLARDFGRRVAHITVDRIVGQEYPVLEAARALLEVICEFRDAKPPDFVADLGNLSPHWAARPGFGYCGPAVVTTSAAPDATVAIVGDMRPTVAEATADAIPPVVTVTSGRIRTMGIDYIQEKLWQAIETLIRPGSIQHRLNSPGMNRISST